MKWLLVLALVLFIETTIKATYQHHVKKSDNKIRNLYKKEKQHKYDVIHEQEEAQRERQHVNNNTERDVDGADDMDYYKRAEAEVNNNTLPTIEIDMPQCPQGCVCQYAHFMDLPISRWINYMQTKYTTKRSRDKKKYHEEEDEDFLQNNELSYEENFSYLMNPFIKQATCIIQEDTDAENLINSLPHDMQALVLLYTGIGKNKTVTTSILKPLNQLTTLEIRGPQDLGLRLVLDAPLNFLKHANFEYITLMGSEIFKRPKNVVHPKEVFDYKPNIELLNSLEFDENTNVKQYDQKLLFELQQQEQEELEILPYEVYKEEVKKAQMPSFYGWEHLQVLRIQSCGLNELSWEMFIGLEELQHLSLERNDIVVVPPFALSGATQLKTLSLAHNNILDLHYRNLAGLFELQVLDLSDNHLTKLTELSFPPLPKLERIDFRHNPIRYIFPATFWVMNHTQEMYFGSDETALELWGNQPFKKLTLLRVMEINNVSIHSLDQNIFKDLIALEKLKLRGEVGIVEFDAFSGFSQLEELDLSLCQIKDISMDALIGCKSLRKINLSSNNISYIPPGLFDDPTSLEEIYLNDNQLKTLPKTFFQQKKLQLVRLTDNPWKCSCDMFNWKAKITNQELLPYTERCINDYFSGKKLSCRKVNAFQFNKTLAPRCDNFQGRSVYYVMRKHMQCNKKYIDLKTKTALQQRKPHWLKLQERKERNKQNIHSQVTENKSQHLPNRMMLPNKIFHQNSLSYEVHKMTLHLKDGKQDLNQRQKSEDEISNEIK